MSVEIRDGKKILVTPISAEDLKDIKIGDIVYLSGSLTTCRDVAHRRVVEEGREIPERGAGLGDDTEPGGRSSACDRSGICCIGIQIREPVQ